MQSDLFQRIESKGVSFHKRRLQPMPSLPPTTPVEAQAAQDLFLGEDRDRLRVQPPDASIQFSLRSEQDVEELAFFNEEGSATTLESPALAQQLHHLSEQGWKFHLGDEAVGSFGAYNRLTEPEHFQGELEARFQGVKFALPEPNEAKRVAEFYLGSHERAELEKRGFQFFNAKKSRTSALHVQQDGWVGQGNSTWFKIEDAENLTRKAERFLSLREATRSTSQTTTDLPLYEALLDAPPEQRLGAARGLAVKGVAQSRLAVRTVAGTHHQETLRVAELVTDEFAHQLCQIQLEDGGHNAVDTAIDRWIESKSFEPAIKAAWSKLEESESPSARYVLSVKPGKLSDQGQALIYRAALRNPGNPIEAARAAVADLGAAEYNYRNRDIGELLWVMFRDLPGQDFPAAALGARLMRTDQDRWRQSHDSDRSKLAQAVLDSLEKQEMAPLMSQILTQLLTDDEADEAKVAGEVAADHLELERPKEVARAVSGDEKLTDAAKANAYLAAFRRPADRLPDAFLYSMEQCQDAEEAARIGAAGARACLRKSEFSDAMTLALEAAYPARGMRLSRWASAQQVLRAAHGSPEITSGPELAAQAHQTLQEIEHEGDRLKVGQSFLEALRWKPETRLVSQLALRLQEGLSDKSRAALYEAALGAPEGTDFNGLARVAANAVAKVEKAEDRELLRERLGRELLPYARSAADRDTLSQLAAGSEALETALERYRTGAEIVFGGDHVQVGDHDLDVN